jgi:hypothetical protein
MFAERPGIEHWTYFGHALLLLKPMGSLTGLWLVEGMAQPACSSLLFVQPNRSRYTRQEGLSRRQTQPHSLSVIH